MRKYISVVLILTLTLGCKDDIEQDNTGFPNTNFGEMLDGEFEKSNRKFVDRDIDELLGDASTDGFQSYVLATYRGREHMNPNEDHNQFALYAGEKFVLDVGYKIKNVSVKEYDFVVLSNMSTVPSALLVADKEYFDMSTLNSMSLNYSEYHSLVIKDSGILKFTIVFDPSSFVEKGMHDLRILAIPKPVAGAGRNTLRTLNMSFGVTVYYDGASPKIDDHSFHTTRDVNISEKELYMVRTGIFNTSVLLPDASYLKKETLGLTQPVSLEAPNFEGVLLKSANSPSDFAYVNLFSNGAFKGEWKKVSLSKSIPSPYKPGYTGKLISFEADVEGDSATMVTILDPYSDMSDFPAYRQVVDVSNSVLYELSR